MFVERSTLSWVSRLIWPLIALGYVVNLYQRGTASLKRMNAIFSIKPAITDDPMISPQPAIRGEIELRDLTFAYNAADEPVLKNINLTIPAGQTVAFVGRTGSGKSTVTNLIPRILEAPAETVFIDGVSVRNYPLTQLRASIGYVVDDAVDHRLGLAEDELAFLQHATPLAAALVLGV